MGIFYQDSNAILYNLSEKGEPGSLKPLAANKVDAAVEKHVPVLFYEDGALMVRVGEDPHPMTEEHYIEWIFVKTWQGGVYRKLKPGDAPEARFAVNEKQVMGVFAYCNLHGLWEADTNSYRFEQTACSMEFREGCID